MIKKVWCSVLMKIIDGRRGTRTIGYFMRQKIWAKAACCLICAVTAVQILLPAESFAGTVESSKRVDILPGNDAATKDRSTFFEDVSDNGRYVLFTVCTTKNWDSALYIRDTRNSRTKLVAEDNSDYEGNNMSADGRYVVFSSKNATLVEDDTNKKSDVFLYDNRKDGITRISANADGGQGNGHSVYPVIAPNGRYVFYTSSATNLLSPSGKNAGGFFRYDIKTKKTIRLPLGKKYTGGYFNKNAYDNHIEAVSRDGRYITFSKGGPPSDIGSYLECHRYDIKNEKLLRIPNPRTKHHVTDENGTHRSRISYGGRYVTILPGNEKSKWHGDTPFLYDCETKKYTAVASLPQYMKYRGILALDISGDGRYIVYAYASKGKYNFHFYLYNRITKKRMLLSRYRYIAYDKNGKRKKFDPDGAYMDIAVSRNAHYVGISFHASKSIGTGYLLKPKKKAL